VVFVHHLCIAEGRVGPIVDIEGAEPLNANPHILCSGFPALQFLFSVKREHFRRFANLVFLKRASPIPGAGGSMEIILFCFLPKKWLKYAVGA
jgi:hypothetical protein